MGRSGREIKRTDKGGTMIRYIWYIRQALLKALDKAIDTAGVISHAMLWIRHWEKKEPRLTSSELEELNEMFIETPINY